MKSFLKPRQNGFAIIEALIAFLLLGIGVAALLYLQGDLMSGSSESKARAEAMELAKDRTEVLRNYIDKRQYLSVLRSAQLASDEEVIGVNAKYIVCYAGIPPGIPEKPNADEVFDLLKDPVNLEVTVKWPGSDGYAVFCNAGSSKDEKVTLETMLYFMSPVIASAIGSGDTGEGSVFPLLSPFIAGVEKRDDSTDLTSKDTDRSGIDSHKVMLVDADSGVISFYPVDVGINTYTNPTTGRSNVEVLECVDEDGNGTIDEDECEVKLTSFGGIVHRIQGDIIVDDGANSTLSDLTKKNSKLLGLFASPPSYCLFSICEVEADFDSTTDVCEKSNGAEFASYVCYVPGDCTYGSVNSSGAYDFLRCPNPFSIDPSAPPFAPPPGMDDLNGGWYGRIGNFHLELPQDKVCTANTDDVSWKTSSREYVTYRYADSSGPAIISNEGINTPYSAQTFLIVNKQAICSDRIDLILESNLVNDHIERKLYGVKRPKTSPLDLSQDNVVFPLNECVVGSDCPPPGLLLP